MGTEGPSGCVQWLRCTVGGLAGACAGAGVQEHAGLDDGGRFGRPRSLTLAVSSVCALARACASRVRLVVRSACVEGSDCWEEACFEEMVLPESDASEPLYVVQVLALDRFRRVASRELGRVLKLPVLTLFSATTFYHRFFVYQSLKEFDHIVSPPPLFSVALVTCLLLALLLPCRPTGPHAQATNHHDASGTRSVVAAVDFASMITFSTTL